MSYRADKQVIDTQTDRHTHTEASYTQQYLKAELALGKNQNLGINMFWLQISAFL